MPALLRCHVAAFEAFGGAPSELLYDRMRTAVSDEGDQGGIVYNRAPHRLGQALRLPPSSLSAHRPRTTGKVERPFRYTREDFFLARSFRNLIDLSQKFRRWLDGSTNALVHATTLRPGERACI